MNTFAALDFETANQYRNSVCSIGLVFTVSAYFGFDLKQHHHALADAEACAHIALELFKWDFAITIKTL